MQGPTSSKAIDNTEEFNHDMKWSIFRIIILATILVQTNTYLLVPNFGVLIVDLRVNEFLLGLMIGVYALILGLSAILWGYLIDKVEKRRNIVIFSLLFAGILTFLSSLSPDFTSLFIARILTAFFLGVVSPATYSICLLYTSPSPRDRG